MVFIGIDRMGVASCMKVRQTMIDRGRQRKCGGLWTDLGIEQDAVLDEEGAEDVLDRAGLAD